MARFRARRTKQDTEQKQEVEDLRQAASPGATGFELDASAAYPCILANP